LVGAVLDPDHLHVVAQEGEQADAVAAPGDLVEVLVEGVPGQPLEHPLLDFERGLDVEREPGDRTEGS
jgi:hypothetical protein